MSITLFGTCRLNKINNHNNLNNLINYTHSTKEIIQFIKFIKGELIIAKPYDKLCFRTGIMDNKCINYNNIYKQKFIDTKIFIIEICSYKNYIHNGYYLHHLSVDKRFPNYTKTPLNILNNYKLIKQNNKEIENDIIEIRKLLYPKKIIIVSHYNSILNDGKYIQSRNHLIILLHIICKKHEIHFINPKNVLSKFAQNIIMTSDLGHYTDFGLNEFSKYMNNYVKMLI